MDPSWRPAIIFPVPALIVLAAHTVCMPWFSPPWRVDALWPTYLFLIGLYELTLVFLVWVEKKHPRRLGFGFLGGGGMKMMVTVIYLLAGPPSEQPNIKPTILHIMIPYFVFLTIETALVFRRVKAVI